MAVPERTVGHDEQGLVPDMDGEKRLGLRAPTGLLEVTDVEIQLHGQLGMKLREHVHVVGHGGGVIRPSVLVLTGGVDEVGQAAGNGHEPAQVAERAAAVDLRRALQPLGMATTIIEPGQRCQVVIGNGSLAAGVQRHDAVQTDDAAEDMFVQHRVVHLSVLGMVEPQVIAHADGQAGPGPQGRVASVGKLVVRNEHQRVHHVQARRGDVGKHQVFGGLGEPGDLGAATGVKPVFQGFAVHVRKVAAHERVEAGDEGALWQLGQVAAVEAQHWTAA
ncbi:hypothetical protein B7463_g10961, partial [Scytalidium lignicola]